MFYKKTELLKLLNFIGELIENPENEWFKNELAKKLSPSSINTDLVNDLKRTKFYLRNVDKNYYLQGFDTYKHIKDRQLKKNLILDYKEMNIALSCNDILEYGRRMSLQLERCFDAVIMEVNGWNEVNANSELYEKVYINKNSQYPYKVKNGFFDNFKGENTFKELSKIEFRIKALFCCIYYGVELSIHWRNLDTIYFLRNKASHGKINDKDKDRLDKIVAKFPEINGYYYKTFHHVIKSLKDIFGP